MKLHPELSCFARNVTLFEVQLVGSKDDKIAKYDSIHRSKEFPNLGFLTKASNAPTTFYFSQPTKNPGSNQSPNIRSTIEETIHIAVLLGID